MTTASTSSSTRRRRSTSNVFGGSVQGIEILNTETNPYRATIGLRVEPAPDGSVSSSGMVDHHRQVLLYVFKKLESFGSAMEEYVREQHGRASTAARAGLRRSAADRLERLARMARNRRAGR